MTADVRCRGHEDVCIVEKNQAWFYSRLFGNLVCFCYVLCCATSMAASRRIPDARINIMEAESCSTGRPETTNYIQYDQEKKLRDGEDFGTSHL